MSTLVLMRHAKAEAFADDDRTRSLTERGHRDAIRAGEWLRSGGWVPDHALVSTAARTRETWQDLASSAGSEAQAAFDDGLYSAGPDTMLDLLLVVDPAAEVVVVVGHNPTVASLAQTLTDAATADPDAFRAMSREYPTSATAVFDVAVAWADVTPGTLRLAAFWTP